MKRHLTIRYVCLALLALSASGACSKVSYWNVGSAGDGAALPSDPGAPRILSITTSLSSGTYGYGDSIAIDVTYDRVIALEGSGCAPSFRLETSPSRVRRWPPTRRS